MPSTVGILMFHCRAMRLFSTFSIFFPPAFPTSLPFNFSFSPIVPLHFFNEKKKRICHEWVKCKALKPQKLVFYGAFLVKARLTLCRVFHSGVWSPMWSFLSHDRGVATEMAKSVSLSVSPTFWSMLKYNINTVIGCSAMQFAPFSPEDEP